MPTIKIISNPYEKKIAFQRLADGTQKWIDINIENDSNSKLITDKLIKSFFPFKIKEIVDIIIDEYFISNEKISIIFEGADDEYKELLELCSEESYKENIEIKKSDIYLDNARDILPEINEVFNEKLRPLILQSISYEKIESELEKYADASDDIIPICVLGNYSTGKSTFINALIGSEILPSGAESLTSKIHKIKQSAYSDRAFIRFQYNGEDIKLKFNESTFKFDDSISENSLVQKISKALQSLENATLTLRVNKSLEVINCFDAGDLISDTIEIEVPFIAGMWGKAANKFVIFDTPGSNSSTNEEHSNVLKEAMEGFSNGLPIFISAFDQFDSIDNEKLCKEIENREELDSRFTMIVINKADSSLDKDKFSQDDENRLLSSATLKRLYTCGIFFVSSVMALGAKNNGLFNDQHYMEIYEEKKSKFQDKKSRFYKQLYTYNIMPEQMKKQSVIAAENECENDAVFVNSGMFTIENYIQTFAQKYSGYNKGRQMLLFLKKIISIVSDEIQSGNVKQKELEKKLTDEFEQDKKSLNNQIKLIGSETFENAYQLLMQDIKNTSAQLIAAAQIRESMNELEKDKQKDDSFKICDNEAKASRNKLYDNLKNNTKNIFANRNLEAFKSMGKDLVEDYKEKRQDDNELKDAKNEIDKDVYDNILETITEKFKLHFEEAISNLFEGSKEFWEKRTEQMREQLIEIITGAATLNEEKRQELTNIIMNYDRIIFENPAEEIFFQYDFKRGLRIGNITILNSEKLNAEKLARTYNAETTKKIKELHDVISSNHFENYRKWNENLISLLTENIVEYSTLLHAKEEEIFAAKAKIKTLEKQQEQLAEYANSIKKMLDWKQA